MTRTGVALLAGSVVLYATGWILGWAPLVAIATAGVLALASAVVWILRRPDLTVERALPVERVARGDEAIAVLTLRNRSRWPSPRLVGFDRFGDQSLPVALPRITHRANATVAVSLPTNRRGVYAVGPLRVEHADPFGLLRREQPLGRTSTLWVHPKVHPLVALPTRRSPSLEGPMADTVPTGSITFHALREYVRGDDLRHIHWRSTAKTGTLMVREHVDTSRPDTTVVLDADPAAYEEEGFEEAVDAAASVLASVAMAGFPARLVTTSGLRLGDGAAVVAPSTFLDELAGMPTQVVQPMPQLLDHLRRGQGSGTLVVVSGELDPSVRTRLWDLRPRFDRVVLVTLREGAAGLLPRSPGVVEVTAPDARSLVAAWAGVAAL